MRIVIDMQGCQNDSRFRGIGRYSIGMISALLDQLQPKHECILLFNGMLNDNLSELLSRFHTKASSSNIKIWNSIGPTGSSNDQNKDRYKISTIIRDKVIEKINPDIVFMSTYFDGFGDNTILSIPAKRKYKAIVTCHDLIPLILSSIYLDPTPNYKKYYLNKLNEFKNADGFLAVSESSKNELIEYLNIPESKIVNTLEGIENKFKNSNPTKEKIENIIKKDLENRKVILYFGASDERKNHLKLIKAFSLMESNTRNQSMLVLAGIGVREHYNKFKSYAEKCGLTSDEFTIVGNLTDKEVIDLYSYSYLYVFPSLHEGFGLPALEAMTCGTPAITANTTSLPEVIGRSDLTFNPYSSIDIKKKLEKIIINETFYDEITEYCIQQAKTFSWEKSATIAINFMEKFEKNLTTVQSNKNLLNECIDKITTHKLSRTLNHSDKEQLTLNLIKNFRMDRKSRIYYDVSNLILVEFVTGIQRVTKEVYQQLYQHYSSTFEIIPVKIDQHSEILTEIKNNHLFKKNPYNYSSADINDLRPGDIYINIDLDHSAHTKSNAYKKMRRHGCLTFFIVHDLLPLSLGDHFFGEGAATSHFRWFKEVAKSNSLICVSQSVKNHVEHALNSVDDINEELQLGWFHLGGDFSSKQSNQIHATSPKFTSINFQTPVYLMVGSLEPRKGHLEVIEAFTDLWDDGYEGSLVIIGARGWNNDLVLELIHSNQYKNKFLFWPDKVSDLELAFLYKKANALIAASIGEGFGLPLIEALQQGTNVIARDIPVFREVTKNSATYFKNTDEFKNILLSKKLPHIPNVIEFNNWKKSTDQLMDVILKNSNSTKWKVNDNLKIYPIYSDRFNSTVGIYKSDRILTNSKAGLLVWGGYFPLEIGTYELQVFGRSFSKQKIDVKIISLINDETHIFFEQKNISLQSPKNTYYDIPETIISIEFNLSKSLKNTEIYIEVNEKNNLYISGFEFLKIENIP